MDIEPGNVKVVKLPEMDVVKIEPGSVVVLVIKTVVGTGTKEVTSEVVITPGNVKVVKLPEMDVVTVEAGSVVVLVNRRVETEELALSDNMWVFQLRHTGGRCFCCDFVKYGLTRERGCLLKVSVTLSVSVVAYPRQLRSNILTSATYLRYQ